MQQNWHDSSIVAVQSLRHESKVFVNEGTCDGTEKQIWEWNGS